MFYNLESLLKLKNHPLFHYQLSIILPFRHFFRTCTIFDTLKLFNGQLGTNYLHENTTSLSQAA